MKDNGLNFLVFSFVLFHTDGLFDKSAIKDFVFANKLPLVTTFSRESASLIFESPIKKQVDIKNNINMFLHVEIWEFTVMA